MGKKAQALCLQNHRVLIRNAEIARVKSGVSAVDNAEGFDSVPPVFGEFSTAVAAGSKTEGYQTPSDYGEVASGSSISHNTDGVAYVTIFGKVKSGISASKGQSAIGTESHLAEQNNGIFTHSKTDTIATGSVYSDAKEGVAVGDNADTYSTHILEFPVIMSGSAVSQNNADYVTTSRETAEGKSGVAISQVNDTIVETSSDAALTFIVVGPDSFGIKTRNNKKNWDGTLYYSTDKVVWHEWDGTSTITSGTGVFPKIHLRGVGNTHMTDKDDDQSGFESICADNTYVFLSGPLDALLDYRTVTNGGTPTRADYAFSYLFAWDVFYPNHAISPHLILSTSLTPYCYAYLFYSSQSTNVTEMPATTLAVGCYKYMYCGCKNLNTLPALPAKNLTPHCYYAMFANCDKIKLSATQTGEYQNAFRLPPTGLGTGADGATTFMFLNTGGTYTADLIVKTTYYTSNQIITS